MVLTGEISETLEKMAHGMGWEVSEAVEGKAWDGSREWKQEDHSLFHGPERPAQLKQLVFGEHGQNWVVA